MTNLSTLGKKCILFLDCLTKEHDLWCLPAEYETAAAGLLSLVERLEAATLGLSNMNKKPTKPTDQRPHL